MRFKRYYRHTDYIATPRKIAAIKRKQRLELDKYPLIADEISENFKSVDEVILERKVNFRKAHGSLRHFQAQTWLRARKKLFSYSLEERKKLIYYWDNAHCHANASSFADFLHSYEVRHNYLINGMNEFFKEKSTKLINKDIIEIEKARDWLTTYLLNDDNYIVNKETLFIDINKYLMEAQESLSFIGIPCFKIGWKKTINKMARRIWIDDKFIIKSEEK